MDTEFRFIMEIMGGVVAITGPLFVVGEPVLSFAVLALAAAVFISSYQSKNMGGIWLSTFAVASLTFVMVSARLMDLGPL